jgi:hypothetical protein
VACAPRIVCSWRPGGNCVATSGAPRSRHRLAIGALLELGAAAAERGVLVVGAAFGFAPAAVREGQVGTFSLAVPPVRPGHQ